MLSRSLFRRMSTIVVRTPQPIDLNTHIYLQPEVISESEGAVLTKFLDIWLRKKRYRGSHWDDVITRYKEIELSSLDIPEDVREITAKLSNLVRAVADIPGMDILPAHVIDLNADGRIGAHVDSIKFSGGLIASTSLMSTRILRLAPYKCDKGEMYDIPPDKDIILKSKLPALVTSELLEAGSAAYSIGKFERKLPDDTTVQDDIIECIVPPRSMYIISGPLRYQYTHEILGKDDETRLIEKIPPVSRRLSLILRDR